MTATLNPPRPSAPAPEAQQLMLVTSWTPPLEFLEWKELPGAGLVMQAYYKYSHWDWRRYMTEGVKSSARFIEERVRDDIRCGKKRGIALAGYTLNSHLTKPILMHILTEYPERRVMYDIRDKEHSELPARASGSGQVFEAGTQERRNE